MDLVREGQVDGSESGRFRDLRTKVSTIRFTGIIGFLDAFRGLAYSNRAGGRAPYEGYSRTLSLQDCNAQSRTRLHTFRGATPMNKSELVEALARETDTTKADAQRTIDAIFGTKDGIVTRTLMAGDRVQITGFGTFETRQRKARTGRNPRTGEAIKIGPTTSPTFRPGKALKDAVKK